MREFYFGWRDKHFYLNIMVREPYVKCCSCISDLLCQPGASKSCERRPGDFIIIII